MGKHILLYRKAVLIGDSYRVEYLFKEADRKIWFLNYFEITVKMLSGSADVFISTMAVRYIIVVVLAMDSV